MNLLAPYMRFQINLNLKIKIKISVGARRSPNILKKKLFKKNYLICRDAIDIMYIYICNSNFILPIYAIPIFMQFQFLCNSYVSVLLLSIVSHRKLQLGEMTFRRLQFLSI